MKPFFDLIQKNPLITIIVFGVLLRLFIVLVYQHVTIFPDAEGYIYLGNLLHDGQLSGYNGERTPGYPLLLTLTANNLNLVVFFQFIIGLLTSIILYKNLLLLKFEQTTALATCLFLSGFLHVIFYETAILTEALTLFFMVATLNCYLRVFFENTSLKGLFLFSFLLGYLVFIKPFYIYLPFIFYAFFVVKDFHISRFFNKRILIFFFPIISFLGWSYVNKINTGYFVPTTFYGFNISQNCVYFAEKTPDEFKTIRDIYVKHREIALKEHKDVAMSIWFAYDDLRAATGLPFVELSDELNRYGKTAIQNNPSDYLYQVVFRSWVDFWKVDMYWNYRDFKVPYANKCLIGIWYIQSTILLLIKIVFILLLPLQVFEFLKRKKITHELVFAMIVFATSVLQAISTYGNNSRFSFPFEFLMVIVVLLFVKRKGYLNTLLKR